MSSTTVDVVDNKTGPHGGSEPEHAPAAGRFPLRSRWHWRACGQSVRGGVTHALQQAADRSARRARHSRPGRTARLSGPTCARELFPSRTCGAPGGPLHPSAMMRTVVQTAASAQCQPRHARPDLAGRRSRAPSHSPAPSTDTAHARSRGGRRSCAGVAPTARADASVASGTRRGRRPALVAMASASEHGLHHRHLQTLLQIWSHQRSWARGLGRRPQRESGGQSAPFPAVQARTTASLPQSSRTLVTQTVGGCLLSYDVTSGSDSERREAQ